MRLPFGQRPPQQFRADVGRGRDELLVRFDELRLVEELENYVQSGSDSERGREDRGTPLLEGVPLDAVVRRTDSVHDARLLPADHARPERPAERHRTH